MGIKRIAQRIRVAAGFALAPLLLIVAEPTPASLIIGAALSIVGLAIRAWASGHVKKNEELATSGPYAYTRNPLYLGTFLLGTGVAICSGKAWFVAVFVALYLLIYLPVMWAEAETLEKLFPSEYEEYRKNVPLFFPRLTPYRPPGNRSNDFETSLYLSHREYRAALGFVAILALLTAKLLL